VFLKRYRDERRIIGDRRRRAVTPCGEWRLSRLEWQSAGARYGGLPGGVNALAFGKARCKVEGNAGRGDSVPCLPPAASPKGPTTRIPQSRACHAHPVIRGAGYAKSALTNRNPPLSGRTKSSTMVKWLQPGTSSTVPQVAGHTRCNCRVCARNAGLSSAPTAR